MMSSFSGRVPSYRDGTSNCEYARSALVRRLTKQSGTNESLRQRIDIVPASLSPDAHSDHHDDSLSGQEPVDDAIALTAYPNAVESVEFAQERFALAFRIATELLDTSGNDLPQPHVGDLLDFLRRGFGQFDLPGHDL